MKYICRVLIILLLSSACSNTNHFASINNELEVQKNSEKSDLSYQQTLQSLVEKDETQSNNEINGERASFIDVVDALETKVVQNKNKARFTTIKIRIIKDTKSKSRVKEDDIEQTFIPEKVVQASSENKLEEIAGSEKNIEQTFIPEKVVQASSEKELEEMAGSEKNIERIIIPEKVVQASSENKLEEIAGFEKNIERIIIPEEVAQAPVSSENKIEGKILSIEKRALSSLIGKNKKFALLEKNIEQNLFSEEERAVQTDKLDLLFYMDTRRSRCMSRFRSFSEKKGFLHYLAPFDWQLSFSFYAQEDEMSLLPLEEDNGRPYKNYKKGGGALDYILSKGEYSKDRSEQLLNTTLKAVGSIRFHEEASPRRTEISHFNSNGNVENPLSGLDYLLSQTEVPRSDSRIVVLLFAHESFPYYALEEWDRFLTKHKNVSIVVLSSRLANVSNLMNVLEKPNVDFLAFCDNNGPKDYKNLIKIIQNKVN